jgi:hypothetical protein
MKVLQYLLEIWGLGAIMALMVYLPWTKLALGGVLTVLGAFFPDLRGRKNLQEGTAQVRFANVLLNVSGGLRYAVVIAGIVVLIGAVADGHQEALRRTGASPITDSLADFLKRKGLSEEYVAYLKERALFKE